MSSIDDNNHNKKTTIGKKRKNDTVDNRKKKTTKTKTELVEVEEIRGCQLDEDSKKKSYLYLIKIKDQEETQNAWFKEVHILDKDLIKQYHAQQIDSTKQWKWQYYIDVPINGKVKGWYDFDMTQSILLENNYQLKKDKMVITTSHYQYDIDLVDLVQVNTTTQTKRLLRRV